MVLRRLLTVGIFAFALLLGSCVTNSASIYIAGVVAMDLEECSLDPGGSRLSYSSVDVGVTSDIVIAFVVQNLIQQRNFNVATDVSTVIVNEAEISLRTSSGATVEGAFIVDAASGVIPGSGDGVSPGEGVVLLPVIPAATLALYRDTATPVTIVAQITLRGRTNGNIEVEGGPFTWTIVLNPLGTFGVPCGTATGESRRCCAPGQNGETYCTNINACALQ